MKIMNTVRFRSILLDILVFSVTLTLLAGITFRVKKKFEDLKADQQQQAEKLGYKPGDTVEIQISPDDKGDKAIAIIMPKPADETKNPISPKSGTTTSNSQDKPQAEGIYPEIKSRFDSEFIFMKKTAMGSTLKKSILGKSVDIVIGEILGLGLYKGFALFDALPQKVKAEAFSKGYKQNDIVGFKVIDNSGTMLEKNVIITREQLQNLKGMVLEMPAAWNKEEKLGKINAIWQESTIEWNPEFLFTLVSLDGKAEKTFPGYHLLDCKFRPELKTEPTQDGNFLGKVVEIWFQWHDGEKVGIVTAFANDAGHCQFTLKSLDGLEERSFETSNRDEIKVVANNIEDYKKKQ